MNDTIYQAAALIIPLVIAIVFHEIAHGWTARALGDPTADELGRLSLNPLRHVDLFGTIILPGILKLSGLPVFGWAKPVPVDFRRLNNPRRDMMLVGAAGPAMNFAMALGAAISGFISETFSPRYCLAAMSLCVLIGYIIIANGHKLLSKADRLPKQSKDDEAINTALDRTN